MQGGVVPLDTGFRLSDPTGSDKSVGERHNAWVRSISKMAKRRPEPVEGENA